MFKFVKNKVAILSILIMFFTPLISFAGLVKCGVSGGQECSLCDLYILIDDLIDFMMITITPALAVLVISYGGFFILTAGGDPSRKKTGYNAMKTAFVGVLIVFSAWVIINEFLLFLSGQSNQDGVARLQSPWTEISCKK